MYAVRTNLRHAVTRLEEAQKKLRRAYQLAQDKGYADNWLGAIGKAVIDNRETIIHTNNVAAGIIRPK